MNLKIVFLFVCGSIFCCSLSAQENSTFFKEQFKLSMGTAKGQPPLLASFKWSKGLGASVEYNRKFSKRFSWGCEFGFTFDTDKNKTNFFYFYLPNE